MPPEIQVATRDARDIDFGPFAIPLLDRSAPDIVKSRVCAWRGKAAGPVFP
jgi:hypothetical protein